MSFRASTGAYALLGPVKTEEKLLHKEQSDMQFFFLHILSSYTVGTSGARKIQTQKFRPKTFLVKKRNHGKTRSYYYSMCVVHRLGKSCKFKDPQRNTTNIKCITWSFILPALVLKIPCSTHILLKFCSDICSYYSFLSLFSKILELIYGVLSI